MRIPDTQQAFLQLGNGRLFDCIPVPVLVMTAVFVAMAVVLHRTRFGQHLYAIGGNPEASRFSGLHVRTLTGLTYIFSGFTMGVAGLLAASQLSSAQAQMERLKEEAVGEQDSRP